MRGVARTAHNITILFFAVFIIVGCGGGGGGGSTPTPTPDIQPAPFAPAEPQTGMPVGQPYNFPAFDVAGVEGSVNISIMGGSYSIDDGEFTTAQGQVSNGDSVRVQVTASDMFSTSTSAILMIGSGSGVFTVQSEAEDTEPEAFELGAAKTVNAPGATAESDLITVVGINSQAAITIEGGEYRIGEGAYTSDAGTVMADDQITVRVAGSQMAPGEASATLTIGGVTDTFVVNTEDTTPPTAEVVFPTPNTLTDGDSITLRGNASDDFGPIARIRVTVTTDDGTTEVDSDVIEAGEGDDFSQTWSLNVSLGAEKLNTIRVEGIDGAGNVQAEPTVLTMLQAADAQLTRFPAGNDVFFGDVASSTSIDIDPGNDRLLMTLSGVNFNKVMSVSLTTGERTFFIEDEPSFVGVFNLLVSQDLNRLFFADGNGDAVLGSSLDDSIVSVVTDSSNQNSNTEIESAIGLALHGVDGLLYVTDPSGMQIFKVDLETGDRTLVSSNTVPNSENPFQTPWKLLLDEASEKAIVCDRSTQQVLSVDLTSGAREEVIASGELMRPVDMAWAEKGVLAILVDSELQTLFNVDVLEKSLVALASDDLPAGAANSLDAPLAIATDESNKVGYVVTVSPSSGANSAIKAIDITTGERVILSNSIEITP